MKTIIAGSRSILDLKEVIKAISEANFSITEVVSGGAKGVDQLGEAWARMNNRPIKQFLPDWDKDARAKWSAGSDRNQEMADYAEALILVWDGKSRGSLDMHKRAVKKGLKIYVHRTEGTSQGKG